MCVFLKDPTRLTILSHISQAQTPEQRRRNAKFAKDQESRRGKSEADIQQRGVKIVQKSPISPFWLGKFFNASFSLGPRHSFAIGDLRRSGFTRTRAGFGSDIPRITHLADLDYPIGVLGFVVFGGLVFELVTRLFGR